MVGAQPGPVVLVVDDHDGSFGVAELVGDVRPSCRVFIQSDIDLNELDPPWQSWPSS